MIGGTLPARVSTRNERQNFFCKGDDNTAGNGKKTVSALGRIVAFQRQTDLHNTEAEQDQADGANQAKHKVGQIVHDLQRIAVCRKRSHRHHADNRHHQDNGAVSRKSFLNLPLKRERGVVSCFSRFVQMLHRELPPCSFHLFEFFRLGFH